MSQAEGATSEQTQPQTPLEQCKQEIGTRLTQLEKFQTYLLQTESTWLQSFANKNQSPYAVGKAETCLERMKVRVGELVSTHSIARSNLDNSGSGFVAADLDTVRTELANSNRSSDTGLRLSCETYITWRRIIQEADDRPQTLLGFYLSLCGRE